MKKTVKSLISTCLALVFIVCLTACGVADSNDVWASATYRQDTAFGEGAKTITVEVKAQETTVVFTVKTDKSTVGEALIEHNLIEGEESQYGLYVIKVNGITADYDVNQSYWAFYIDGEYALSGVDTTEIAEGVTYHLEYTKG